jgi:hypothetical protein
MQDDTHEGYFIPSGSVVIANIWYMILYYSLLKWLTIKRNMTHDENIYTDPMTFRPERFLDANPEPDPMDVAFGFGR